MGDQIDIRGGGELGEQVLFTRQDDILARLSLPLVIKGDVARCQVNAASMNRG